MIICHFDCHWSYFQKKMDKKTVAKRAREIESKEQLLWLLNQMKHDDMADVDGNTNFHPFTMRHINYYCNPNNAFHRYKHFEIRKKTGGARLITSPRNQSFMLILRYVNDILKALYTPSEFAMGFAEGRSVVTNASIHIGQNYIFNIDLKDFFSSIEQARVWKRLQLEPIGLKRPLASIIAGLCSMKVKDEEGKARYILPQGAPTSPIITNMICDTLDRRLAGLAKRFGLRYSRYADDISFSSMHNVYHAGGEFRTELVRIIESQGFKINSKKTRQQKVGGHQEVTGIVVSDKLNVTQRYVRDIRNILYIWDRYGYNTAFNKFYPKYQVEKGHVKKSNPDMVNVLDGKLLYLKMVKGEDDNTYRRLRCKFEKLAKKLQDKGNTTNRGVAFIETIPVLEFEKMNNTTINITTSKPEEVPWKKYCIENGEYLDGNLLIPHRCASFSLGGMAQLASVNKTLTSEEEKKKEILSISHCRDERGKFFWLIHRSDKMMVPVKSAVDIDDLNNELDNLLIE